jgi:hypothetical protein
MYYVQETSDYLSNPGKAIYSGLRVETKKCDYADFKLGPDDNKFALDTWKGYNLYCPDMNTIPNKSLIIQGDEFSMVNKNI